MVILNKIDFRVLVLGIKYLKTNEVMGASLPIKNIVLTCLLKDSYLLCMGLDTLSFS